MPGAGDCRASAHDAPAAKGPAMTDAPRSPLIDNALIADGVKATITADLPKGFYRTAFVMNGFT